MSAPRGYVAAATFLIGSACGLGIPDPPVARRLDEVSGRFEYRAYASSGSPLLVGTITLAVAPDSSLTGSWDIRRAAGADTTAIVGPQIGSGTLVGYAGSEQSLINLNPGWADNNVFLMMPYPDEVPLAGQWQYSTFVGPVAQGRFELLRR